MPRQADTVCEFCNQALPGRARFCSRCGARVGARPAEPAPVAFEPPVVSVSMVRCGGCGNLVSDTADACPHCSRALATDIRRQVRIGVTTLGLDAAQLAETLGIETAGGTCTPILPRGTRLPASLTDIFSTAADDQAAVMINLMAGESRYARENRLLCRAELSGIPPAARGVPRIEVEFHVDRDGQVTILARDLGTGRSVAVGMEAGA